MVWGGCRGKVNVGKSIVLAVGSSGDLGTFGLKVKREKMKVLGVNMDIEGKGKKVCKKLEGRVKWVEGLWGTRGLSFRGKVQVIKQCLLPLILFTGIMYLLSWLQAQRLKKVLVFVFLEGVGGWRECLGWNCIRRRGWREWGLPNINTFFLCSCSEDGGE